MTAQRHLDRKARTAVTIAGALIVAAPVLMIAKVVAEKVGDQTQPQVLAMPAGEELVQLADGSTMLIRRGSKSHGILEWLKEESGEERVTVGNSNFAAGSAAFTSEGWENVAQFAQLLKAHREVAAVVLYSPAHGDPATEMLERLRAQRIQAAAIEQGVRGEQVSVTREAFEPHHNPANDEGLEVVLTNSG
jgi:hypothetical protein